FVETMGAVRQHIEDERGPFVTEQLQRAPGGTVDRMNLGSAIRGFHRVPYSHASAFLQNSKRWIDYIVFLRLRASESIRVSPPGRRRFDRTHLFFPAYPADGVLMIDLKINGQVHSIDADRDMPLLWALRELVGLTGTKFGCGMAQCGACTVHID